MPNRSISVIMPIYNEEPLLPELFERMTRALNSIEKEFHLTTEWVLVNDGSRDRTLEILSNYAAAEPRMAVINLSRNFGHQSAIQAGLEYAHGDAVVSMDGDLQDPPEFIPELIRSWLKGNKVVVAERRSRAETGPIRIFHKLFHKTLEMVSDLKMQTGSGVFCLFDRQALDEFLRLRERSRFLPGIRSWIGFQPAFVPYDREARAAGKPKLTYTVLLKYGFDAIFSFSFKPLRAIWTLGITISSVSFLYAIVLLILRILNVNVVAGFTTQTVAILLLGGVQLISVGILGEYLGRIYDEVKQRPHYIIREVIRQASAD